MLVKYGAIVTQASGSLGSVTFVNRQGSPMIRTKPRHIDRNTPDQMAHKTAYAQAIQAWRNLGSGNKLAWQIYAAKNQRQNRLGTWRRLSGAQFFMKEAIVRIGLGIGTPAAPPRYGQQGIGTPVSVYFTDGGPYTVEFNTPTIDPDGWYLFTGHRPMSTTAYKKPYYHVLPAQYVEDTGNFDLYDDWCAVMGEMATNELFIIQVRYCGKYSLTSAPATWRSIVNAP